MASRTQQRSGLDAIAERIGELQLRRAGSKGINTILSNTTRLLNSTFQAALGRTKASTPINPPDDNRRSQRIAVTPTPSSARQRQRDDISPVPFNRTYSSSGDNLVPPHAPRPHSVTSLSYMRLLPKSLVNLSPGDEVIVVIPPFNDSTPEIQAIMEMFDRVMSHGSKTSSPTQKLELTRQMRMSHSFPRNGVIAHEFPVRIVSCPEHDRIAIGDKKVADKYWADGAGYYVEVCGYTSSAKILLKYSSLPFIEVYKLGDPDHFLHDDINFTRCHNNPQVLTDQLAQFLVLSDGDPITTMESLWKFSKADANMLRRLLQTEKTTMPSIPVASRDGEFNDIIKNELNDKALRSFASMVDNIYIDAFKQKYTSFTFVPDSVLPNDKIIMLYESFKKTFPISHFVLSNVVSNGNPDDYNDDLTNSSNSSITPGYDSSLSLRERCILEHFISFIRIKSERNLRHWSMMIPLGYHSKGFCLPGTRTYLSAHSCNMRTAWRNLGALYHYSESDRMKCIMNQSSLSGAFDNWQYKIQRVFQSQGKSSYFQQATAMFLKLNKAIEIPLGSIMISPSGVTFRVTSCRRIDNYQFYLSGFVVNMADVELDDAMRSDIQRVHTGPIIWPQLGWHLHECDRFDKCRDISYVDQYIPAPSRARVAIDATSDDLLFGRRDFKTAEDPDSRIFTTDDYYHLVCRQDLFQRMHNLWFSINFLHECDGGDEISTTIGDCIIDGLPRNYEKEVAFLSSMSACTRQMNAIRSFQSDVIKHVNPRATDRDKFMHFPLIPHDETSNVGMTMVSASVHENCGLIRKVQNDDYKLCPNANVAAWL